jgi:hypothetical protein
MTIGNLLSKIRQMPSMHSVDIVALQPIPIKNPYIPQNQVHEQRQTNRELLNKELLQLLHPLTFKHNPSTESGNHNVLCADGNIRRWKLLLSAWLADFPQYSDLHHLERHVCFSCECPKNEHGDYVPPDRQHRWRDHNLYGTFIYANTNAGNAEFSSRHVYRRFHVF